MVYFLDLRNTDFAGGVAEKPELWELAWQEGGGVAALKKVNADDVFVNRRILFVTHGFNVRGLEAKYQFARLDAYLNLSPPDLMVGVLWPGDAWIRYIDYPFEASPAMASGRKLAAYCAASCGRALGFAFASHSLGARVMLEAAAHLGDLKPELAVLTAGAINANCLNEEYRRTASQIPEISGLASSADSAVGFWFNIGDVFTNFFHQDHPFFEAALGHAGPTSGAPKNVRYPWIIADNLSPNGSFAHGDYLPPSDAAPSSASLAPGAKWTWSADFIKRAFQHRPQVWP